MVLERNEVADELLQKLSQEGVVVQITEEALADAMSCNSNSGGGCGRSGSCGSSSCRGIANDQTL